MENIFIIYDTRLGDARRGALLFREASEFIVCRGAGEIRSCFDRLDRAVAGGNYAAGFFSYELGLYFQDMPFDKRSPFPLFMFGVFPSCESIPLDELDGAVPDPGGFTVTGGAYSVPEQVYVRDIQRIKGHIRDGNTYQVNYTFKHRFDFAGSPLGLFNELRKRQDVSYAAFMEFGKWSVISLSPELFFEKNGMDMAVRPMKGTIERGRDCAEDESKIRSLWRSAKNRAENVMIVDLLRSDLGRISETGSVVTESLFDVEKYRTLFQMTSTVRSRLKEGLSWHDIMSNIFPSGSVTGAPKRRTMEIIRQTEKDERDIYTGSIGYIAPGGRALFNVAIRTVLIDTESGKADMGIGSGIVHDSDAAKEYEESKLKGTFLTTTSFAPSFELIETMLWEKGEYFLLGLHLERLEKSARYFSYHFDKDSVSGRLEKIAEAFDGAKKYRVRLLMNEKGRVAVRADEMEDGPASPVKTAFSEKSVANGNVFYYHKTTNRALYDAELTWARERGLFDVIFLNAEGEVTEGAITNVIIRKGAEYYTPPVSSGLLPGVYREHLLKGQKLPVKEKVLFKEDLENADEVFLVNSVRGMLPAELCR